MLASTPVPSLENQLRSALLGLAVGDALGVPVEFVSRTARRHDPVLHMRAFGTHHQPAGTWSDDASLTFCLAESIADGFSLAKVAHNCCLWYYHNFWTPHGRVFDIGVTTREALSRLQANPDLIQAGGTDEYSNGNGSLMRILPLAFYSTETSLQSRFQLIFDVSAITHGHIRSAVACFLYLEMASHLRAGHTPAEAYALLCEQAPAQLKVLNIPANEIKEFEYLLTGHLADLPEQVIRSGGYVMHTLEAALWCLLRYNTYAETVLAAVNLGDDTDTTGAVTGGLAGLYYGDVAIPAEWLSVLARRANIEDLAQRIAATLAPALSKAAVPRPLPNSYWATPNILACEYPGDRNPAKATVKLNALLDAGITDFFDLTEVHELVPYDILLQQVAVTRRQTVHYHRFSIPDAGLPDEATLEAILASLADSVAAGRKAAVHCWGGIGRTGTVIGCYLVRYQKFSGSEALAHIAHEWKGVEKSCRIPRSPETDAQFRLVEAFH
ncbi:ADP-ribosylglycohydrolase family protein [Hymenobacter guriensis]|uniref:ADP-ribosylglycohydrolase family protein n=1 Tax=Hymenobacter guriensis TaxID=2793065 RepID=A0ABS0L028_9BACT|nr:ADP-ribosylglycohydrolase family protein [Hymenobacter guriensis]MBG8553460.1 ADP-ribosylglycohydrolase family protein [Hymenobacter guriensis]